MNLNPSLVIASAALTFSAGVLVRVLWVQWKDERDYQRRVQRYYDFLDRPPHDRSE